MILNSVVTPPGGPCPAGSTDPKCTAEVPGRQLTISKAVVGAPAAVDPGATVTYRITVRNTGGLPYESATVVDDLSGVLDAAGAPSGVTASSGTVSVSGSTLTWTGPLPLGATVTIEYRVVVDSPVGGDGRLQNAVSSPTPGARCGVPAGCVTDTPIRSMRVVKTSNPTPGSSLTPGDVVTYTITVTNNGQAPLRAATFTDDLSGVLDDADLRGTPSASTGRVRYEAPVLSWSGDLAVGATATITYRVRVKAGGDGRLDNTVEADGPGSNCAPGSDDGDCTTASSVVVPTPTPTPTPTVPNPNPTPTPTTPTRPTPTSPLPNTGTKVTDTLLLAGLLLVFGTVAVGTSRRKRHQPSA